MRYILGLAFQYLYMLICYAAFQLPFGKLYSLFNPKWVFMTALGLFEVGSLIAGAAPNSTALIIGVSIFLMFFEPSKLTIFLESCSRYWFSGHLQRRYGHYCTCFSAREEARLCIILWWNVRHCVCCRATSRGRLHRQGHLASLLLHQFTIGVSNFQSLKSMNDAKQTCVELSLRWFFYCSCIFHRLKTLSRNSP